MTQKSLLQAAGDGTAVPASYIGQVISATNAVSFNQFAPVSGTYYDIPSLSVSLTTGNWLLTASVPIRIQAPSGAGFGAVLAIRNSTGVVQRQTGWFGSEPVARDFSQPCTVVLPLTVTATETFKLSMKYIGAGGGAAILLGAQNDLGSGDFVAVRIA